MSLCVYMFSVSVFCVFVSGGTELGVCAKGRRAFACPLASAV